MIVTDCMICKTPMAVLKSHHSGFSEELKNHVRIVFRNILSENPIPLAAKTDLSTIYGGEELHDNPNKINWIIDWEQRKIPDHAHCHLRIKPFPNMENWEELKTIASSTEST